MAEDDLHSKTGAGLLRFLDYTGEKGLQNPTTAAARKSACIKVLEIDGPGWRERRIDEIDVEDQVERFGRKSGSKYRPGSLRTYQQRFRDAVADYLEFLKNPTGYRGAPPKSVTRPSSRTQTKERGQASTPRTRTTDAAAGLITYPFPLSGGVLAYVQLPHEISPEDAERMADFLRSVAFKSTSEHK
jgi:hypothetical protein